jgi:hypothetical protein
MHEDSPLRKCSTTTCCSNYTYAYQDFFVATVEDPEGLPPGPPVDRNPPGPSGSGPGSGSGSGSESCEIDISTPGTWIGESRSF